MFGVDSLALPVPWEGPTFLISQLWPPCSPAGLWGGAEGVGVSQGKKIKEHKLLLERESPSLSCFVPPTNFPPLICLGIISALNWLWWCFQSVSGALGEQGEPLSSVQELFSLPFAILGAAEVGSEQGLLIKIAAVVAVCTESEGRVL